MKNSVKGVIFYLLVLFVLIATLVMLYSSNQEEGLKYSEVVSYFDNRQVTEFRMEGSKLIAEIRLNNGELQTIVYTVPYTQLFVDDIADALDEMRQSGTLTYDFEAPYEAPFWLSAVPYLVLIVILGAMWYFVMNQSGGGNKAMSFGRAKTKVLTDDKKKITFADVAGADEEKEELMEVVDFLKNPKKYTEIGARVPKGVLMVGPPGTGKTYLGKAVAGEAGVPFFSISGSDFVEMFVGVGASRVRDLFDQAKKNAPSIVFIDEIDAVGRQRGAGLGGGHDEREQTLNQLLVEMDGFATNEGVIIMAATNRPDILDSALLRPGRFDRQVYVGVPDIKAREAILKIHSRHKPLGPECSLETIAKSTGGFTPADLENLLNEAALLAARRKKKQIDMQEIEEAIIKVVAGPEKKSRVVPEKARRLTAFHEAGHALVSRFLPTQDPVRLISIIPRGRAGGFTMYLPTEDKYYNSKNGMLEDIVSLLGGRVAEKLMLNDISTGASDDISRATEIARKMVTKYGMSDKLGPVAFGSGHDEVFLGRDFAQSRTYSENVAAEIDGEIRSIIDAAYKMCEDILSKYSERLTHIAEYLLKHEKMEGEAFEAVFADMETPPKDSDEVLANAAAEETQSAEGESQD